MFLKLFCVLHSLETSSFTFQVVQCVGVLACIRYCRSYREKGNIQSYGRDNHIWSNNVRSLCIAADGYHPQMVVLLHVINLGTFITL